jgi:hypothetical protein
MKILLRPFMYLAALGLALSVMVHVLSLLGISFLLGDFSWVLHVGIFIVWLPAVLVANRVGKDFRQKDFWKAALRACPKWMKNLAYFFFGYAILNFALFFISDVPGGGLGSAGNSSPANIFRGFSGHWMAFYAVAMAILYSAIHVAEHDQVRRCAKGHPVSPSAMFCEECGSRVVEPQDVG